jgi:hypothetical protein
VARGILKIRAKLDLWHRGAHCDAEMRVRFDGF